MEIFDSFFGNNDNKNNNAVSFPWNILTHEAQLNDEVLPASYSKPVILFKHSTRCIISRTALAQFEKNYTFEDNFERYYLDLISYRTVSNAIANLFEVVYQSPQILVIKDGKCIYHASHESIDATSLERFI